MQNNTKNTGLDFNATNIAPAQANEVLPNGWYNCEVTDAEVLPTKGTGNNERVKIEYKVIDGDFANRKIFDSINHQHTKAQTQEIGQRELSAVCHSTGVLNLTTAQGGVAQFIGKMLQVKVGLGKTTTAYPDPKNEVKGRKALEGAAVAGGPAPAPAQAAPSFAAPAPGAVPASPTPPVPVATPAPPVAVANPIDTAIADGWIAHPESAGYYYKGQEVLPEADVIARYPSAPAAPVAVPEAPVTPAVPTAPATPQAPPFNAGAPATPPVPVATPAPVPTAGGVPATPTGGAPAWATQ